MAHFARISDQHVIERHVVANVELLDENGIEREELGQAFLSNLWGGEPSEYVQMSYNRPDFRGGWADIGWTWKPDGRRKDGGIFEPPTPEAPTEP